MEFETIAAAVIGGCSLRGGIGSIWGTMLGACMLMAIRAGLVMMGINIFLYQILLGILMVLVIAIKEPLSRVA
jgi:ribose/xylose/arabinose/galactoside ABC-type transport system permease subunit